MKSLFSQVDTEVTNALVQRNSKLDAIHHSEWTDELLVEDAKDVNETIDIACSLHGWTGEEYNKIYRRLRDTRHHAY